MFERKNESIFNPSQFRKDNKSIIAKSAQKKMMILDTAYIYIPLLEDESIKSTKNRVDVSLIKNKKQATGNIL